MTNKFNFGVTSPTVDFGKAFPFQNFDFSNFETFNSFTSAQEKFLADDFTGDETKAIEFFFFTPFTEEVFNSFKQFFSTEVFPKIKTGSFLKFNFFNDDSFNFNEFNEFFKQFSADGMFIEMAFFNFPADFNFSEFGLPLDFNGDFFFSFSVSQTSFR